jgi:hypothetical protein
MPLLHTVEWRSYPSYTNEGEYVWIEWTPWIDGERRKRGQYVTYGVHEDFTYIAFAELHEHLEELYDYLLDLPWNSHLWMCRKDVP